MSRRTQLGATLMETVVTLGVVAVAVPALLAGLSTSIVNTDKGYEYSMLFELAQSQAEDLQKQPYQENASNYTLLSVPDGYTASVLATPAASYTYPAPVLTAAPQTVQVLTISVTGPAGSLALETYKLRR